MIEFSCACGRQFHVSHSRAGSHGKCPDCGQPLQVPMPAAPAPVQPTAAPAPVRPVAAPARVPATMPAPVPRTPSPAFVNYPVPASMAAPEQVEQPAADADTVPGFGDVNPSPEAYTDPAAMAGYTPSPYYGQSGKARKRYIRRELHSQGLFAFLGMVLITGFLLPVPGASAEGGRFVWINMEMIGESHAPIAARLFALAPLVAGIAVLIVGNKLRGVARGSTVSAIGIACFAFLLVDVPLRSMLSNLPRIGRELSLAVIGLPIAGFMTMFAGILGLRHRPEYRPLSIVALVGGILFVLFLVIPWGEGISSMPILGVFKDPFEKLPADDRSDPLIQACAILSMLAVTAAAVQCVYFGATGKFSRGRAKLGLWLMVGSVFTAYLTMGLFLNYFLNLIAIGAKSSLLIAAFMYALKFSLWIVGLALLVPVGASELMLGLAERKYGADPGSGFAVQMQSAGAPFAPPSAQTIQPMAPMQPMQPMAPMPPMTPRGHVPRQH